MTAIRGFVPATADRRALGVHSLDRFVLTVPDLAPAQRFYADFGLDVQAEGNALALKTFGHDQRWGTVVEGKRKRLHHHYIPATQQWTAGHHAPEDSFYIWGPEPPSDFTVNHEA